MRSELSIVGFLLVVGFVAWIATRGAPPLPPLAVAGLVMLGALFGVAVGYGAAITERPSSVGGSRLPRWRR